MPKSQIRIAINSFRSDLESQSANQIIPKIASKSLEKKVETATGEQSGADQDIQVKFQQDSRALFGKVPLGTSHPMKSMWISFGNEQPICRQLMGNRFLSSAGAGSSFGHFWRGGT